MTDMTPSWQADPTGRHDHRYWDGTSWTEHVADAGVAAVDPYDGPAAGAATSADPAGLSTGWGATPTEDAGAGASTWGGGTATGWGAPAPSGAADAPTTGTGWNATAAATPTASTPTTWGASASEPTTHEPETSEPEAATPAAEADTQAFPAAGEPTTVWGASETPFTDTGTQATVERDVYEQTVAPAVRAEGEPPKGQGKALLLVGLALFAVVALVVAILLTNDDEDAGGDGDLTSRVSEELREDDGVLAGVPTEDADCVADHIVDQIGPERLDGVNLGEEPPPDLSGDLAAALTGGINACEIDAEQLTGDGSTIGAETDDETDGRAEDGDGSDAAADDTVTADGGNDVDLTDPDQLDQVLVESFTSAYGIDRERAECLASRLTDAMREGTTDPNNPFGTQEEYVEHLEACDITPEEVGFVGT
ncbi:MAG: DUF2510 domain-containing protein [Acidimicrobiales bacterium]|nr:DUF2510 domain-containing protein [Acidimicrobiales bacterium]